MTRSTEGERVTRGHRGGAVKQTRTPSRAVIEQRAPGVIEKDDPVTKLFRELDYFPTPPWAARAIAHRIKRLDPGATTGWEPACGEGHFAEPAREVFGHVHASDIYDYGHGDVMDFLAVDPARYHGVGPDWIFTNPPFQAAVDFIEHALRIAATGVVVLCRLAFVESVDRYPLLWGENSARLTTLMPFAERVPMQLGSWDPDLSSATAYAAFCFHKGHAATKPMGFGPGTRDTYWRDTDPARFAKPAPIPLFDKVAPNGLFTTQGDL